jgi:hypothetical protein
MEGVRNISPETTSRIPPLAVRKGKEINGGILRKVLWRIISGIFFLDGGKV